MTNEPSRNARHWLFAAFILFLTGTFYRPLIFILTSSISVDQYSHILLVIPVSVTLLYQNRQRIFANAPYSIPALISVFVLLGAYAYFSYNGDALSASSRLSLSILLFALCSLAAFTFCYGIQAFHRATFPLLLLLLMVPLPDSFLQKTIQVLQDGSAVATCWLLAAARIPYTRHGVVLALPRINIYIAEECSGIRSSMVLLLCSLVLGHLYLKPFWAKLLLTLAVIPITIAKNALRIFVLSTLGMYVDPSFLSGRLHHDGGFIFFGMAFAALFLLIWFLQRLDSTGHESTANAMPTAP
jgi:exosortase